MSRKQKIVALAVSVFFFTSLIAMSKELEIGPVDGLTTAWHPAPATATVPLGSRLTFKMPLIRSDMVTWRGATEISNDGTWSVAECELNTVGRHVVAAWKRVTDSRFSKERIVLDVVDIRPEQIEISSTSASVIPVEIDEENVSRSAFRYYVGGSIAGLNRVSEDHYRTSVNRWITLSSEVDPPEFTPLIEWRGPGRKPHLGASWRIQHSRPGREVLSVGPTARPREIVFETYSVEITSHISNRSIVPEGVPVEFTAVTDPPGFEEEITWLASTKYGTCDPVMDRGAEFVVQFDGTWSSTDYPLRWLGVKADHVVFNLDQKSIDDIFCSTGEITIRVFPGVLPDHPEGLEETLALSGEGLRNTVVVRSAPPYSDGFDIETEIVDLELAASSATLGEVLVRQREDVSSTGVICEVEAGDDGSFVSGDSAFDVFVEVDLVDAGLTLTTGEVPVRLQAGGITELPPFGRGYLPQPPAGGVCDQPGGPQTIPLILEGVGIIGEIIHALHEIGCPPPDEKDKCRIRLTKIEGAKRNEVGNFDAVTDPHKKSRIFIDTAADGKILESPDKQNVKLEVLVTPATIDPAKYEVLWEVRDPDDPADHVDVDMNDGGTPTGGTPTGGDNIDKLPEDGGHFFREADHAIAGEASPGSDPADPLKVIGRATTALDAGRRSTVELHYGDEGGDNYSVLTHCVLKSEGAIEATSEPSGIFTVWRKREVHAYAMDDPDDGTFRILDDKAAIQGAMRQAYAQVAKPDQNAYLDIVVEEPKDSQETMFFESVDCHCPAPQPADCADLGSYVIDHTNYHDSAQPDGHVDNRYQLLGIKTQLEPPRSFFGDTGREPHSYVAVFTLTESLTGIIGVKDEVFAIASGCTITIEVEDEGGGNKMSQEIKFDSPAFDDGMANADEVVNEIIDDKGALPITSEVVGIGAGADQQRRILIILETGSEDRTIQVIDGAGDVCATLGLECGVVHDDDRQVTRTTVHEIGHGALAQGPDDFDGKLDVHTKDFPCAFYQTAHNTGVDLCPMHARMARENISRSWSQHLEDTQPATIENDSDP